MAGWFNVVNGNEIQFVPSTDRYWPADIVQSQPVSVAIGPGVSWRITGPGAMWMYAHAAAAVAASGGTFEVQLAGAPGTSWDLTGSNCQLRPIPGSPCGVLEIELAVGNRLHDAAIDRLLAPVLTQLDGCGLAELCITGRANGRAYALAAARAVQNQVRRIMC